VSGAVLRRAALVAFVLWGCAGEAGVEPRKREQRFVDARKLYAEKLDEEYQRENLGRVAAKGKFLETLELTIPQSDPTWCTTFPSAGRRELLSDLGYRTVVLRNAQSRQVCRVTLESGRPTP
jgi:hypothetical protein